MSLYLGNPLGDAISHTLFRDLKAIDKEERLDRNTRMPSIANTRQNIPTVDPTMNKWYNYKRSGAEKFEDPRPNDSRPLQWDYNGRNLWMLATLDYNKKKDYPDVITAYPQKVVGRY